MIDLIPKKKPLSGQQRKVAARKKKDAALVGELGGGEAFDVLGDPDLNDPSTALDYTRRALLIAFGQICRSRELPTLERWRLIKDFSAVMGMTSNRAVLESRTKKLELALQSKRQTGAVRFGRPTKPPTARGAPPAGPRVVPADLPDRPDHDSEVP